MAKRLSIIVLRVMIVSAACFGLLVLWGFSSPFGQALGIVLLGRSSDCDWEQTVKAAEADALEKSIQGHLEASSRLIRRESGLSYIGTPKGDYWIPSGSERPLYQDLAEQERKIYGKGREAVREGDIVLDCGANVGLFSKEALEAGAKLVVAIEPAPENIECLRRNLETQIATGRVIVYPKGVWHQDDVLTLYVNPRNSSVDSFVMKWEQSREGLQVALTTIDKLVAELSLPRVDFIKMDIEGSERNALMGAKETLTRYEPRMAICVYHLPDDYPVITNLVSEILPDYRAICNCWVKGYTIRPQVLLYSCRQGRSAGTGV